MTRALILGCSHAAGSEIEKGPNVDLGEVPFTQYGYLHSYPVQLAKLLGYTTVLNHSIPGGSNDAIFRIFESITKLQRPDIVIACWTGSERTEVWHPEERAWQPIVAGKDRFYQTVKDDVICQGRYVPSGVKDERGYLEYQRQWVTYSCNGFEGRLNKIKNVLALHSLAKQYNIRVVNIDSFNTILDYPFGSDIYYPDHSTNFCNWAAAQNFLHTDYGHFFMDAHTEFARYLFEKVDTSYRSHT